MGLQQNSTAWKDCVKWFRTENITCLESIFHIALLKMFSPEYPIDWDIFCHKYFLILKLF